MTKTTFAQGQLRALIERIERLEEEKANIAGDIKEVYAEAKANGFDTTIMRKVVSLRKKDANERQEEEALLDVYLCALGMQGSLFGDETPEPQPAVVASRPVESGGGLEQPSAAPAAPIQNTEPEGNSAGAGEPLTDETVDGVSGPDCDVSHTLKSTDLAHSFENQPWPPASQPAEQAAGVSRIAPAADQFTEEDMAIPPFLDRRVKQLEVA